MARLNFSDKISRHRVFFSLLVITVVFMFLPGFDLLKNIEYRFYDIQLRMQESPEENSDLVLIDVDDNSLSYIGSWPWQRNILSEVLFRLKEFGAETAVFDIEYVTPSSLAVDENLRDIVRDEFQRMEEGIVFDMNSFDASSRDDLTGKILNDYVYEAGKKIQQNMNLNYDDEFAKTIQFFGNAYLTVNLRSIGIDTLPDDIEYVRQRFLFDNVTDEKSLIKKGNIATFMEEASDNERGFVPAIHSIADHAAGMGFTNVVVDSDGLRRRVELINDCDGKYALQLAFSPFVRNAGVTSIERTSGALILHDARVKNQEPADIRIPLDRNGCMNLNWVHKNYTESYSHIPVYYIYDFYNGELRIQQELEMLCRPEYSGLFSDEGLKQKLEETVRLCEESRKARSSVMLKCSGFNADSTPVKKGRRGGGLTEEDYGKFFDVRTAYFQAALSLADEIEASGLSQDEALGNFSRHARSFCEAYEAMKNQLSGKFCFIGNCATSSTDLGATPFEKRYANLGTHANVVNTILSGKFITEVNVYAGLLLGLFCAALVLLATKKSTYGRKNVFGIIYVVVPVAVISFLMVFFRIYIPVVLPALYVILIYISQLVINFAGVNSDRKFLQTTFGSYVAPAVVDQIIKNPDVAKLGGRSEELTALFSDVKTFSGFTEVINNEELKKAVEENNALEESQRLPADRVEALGAARGAERLVNILNAYLGVLSDAIMDNRGTIDKYVGDEIVSFFGAPIPNKDNAFDACVAAVRMLEAERNFNETNRDLLPVNPKTGEIFFLHSRVGLNTGNMVVGNMGTDKKLNYTIMGNNVNLASRLEGTNKAYGSWIMVSESTWNSADSGENRGKLVARKFDCVRVVNVNKPVQIFNVLGLRNELPEAQIRACETFNRGMDLYLSGTDTPDKPKDREELVKAMQLFEEAESIFPDDGSSRVFIERCLKFLKEGIPSPWDGVYTMESK